ncbi:SDR family oxidoreductase [Acidisoma sp.]|uniref:SDR family oxidoreductase n=1 Tax=Acidisoma sp. TaxID=1872115 RepID=UPI003B00FC23
MAQWTTADIPDQTGRSAVVTGAGGLGYETALALARANAEVILAGRSAEKGAASVDRIKAQVPQANIRFEDLDLASLASVAAFANRMAAQHGTLDLLVNNAGVMAPPHRQATTDGFELQFGTNYLGHFALTAHLLPLLRAARAPRVVEVSSIAHRRATIGLKDLQGERSYSPWRSYGQSKLAMLMFAIELQRRSDAGGWGLMSLAAHPGIARTELFTNGPGSARIQKLMIGLVMPFVSQSAAAGALPLLFAATAPGAIAGAYYGPSGLREMKGAVGPARIMPQAWDTETAARLWQVSEALTGVTFGAEAAVPLTSAATPS